MSQKYPGGIISKTAPVPSGPYADSTAPGIWTLEQQAAYAKQGNWPTAGNVDPSAFIENLFSTYLYTGNDGTLPIVNGIDLSTKGGLVWIKSRTYGSGGNHILTDTVRGKNSILYSNTTDSAFTASGENIESFNTTGFTLGYGYAGYSNYSGSNNVSWTFRKQPKFFDVQTWTGDGTSSRAISHALGSTPGCIIIKKTNGAQSWFVYHRSLASTDGLVFTTQAADSGFSVVSATSSTTFTIYTTNQAVNTNGDTYVAYLFAHDAGGFGLTGTDNVISCGSCSSDASGYIQPVNLGYEPQWVMLKRTNSTANWVMMDTMRGMANTAAAASPILLANTSAAEAATGVQVNPTATGFEDLNWGGWGASNTYIYIAIRRGPMAVPTSGTSVFSPIQAAGSTGTKLTTNFPVDLQIWSLPGDGGSSKVATDRLRGVSTNTTTSGVSLYTDLTDAENNASSATRYFDNTGYTIPGNFLGSGYNAIYWNFRRAPSFFDEVCYLGTGSATTVTHNLGVAPELMIVKKRNAAGTDWNVYSSPLGATQTFYLNQPDAAVTSSGAWNNTAPTSSVFTIGTSGTVNASAATYVAYLFATCPGVSKVGSYTGTGTTLQVNCGFTGGARWVMIKRTDSTGDWYVWDSARGIVAGNDPYLLLNSTAAEVTNTDYVDTYSAGFEISSTAPAAINANGGTFIFLAIA